MMPAMVAGWGVGFEQGTEIDWPRTCALVVGLLVIPWLFHFVRRRNSAAGSAALHPQPTQRVSKPDASRRLRFQHDAGQDWQGVAEVLGQESSTTTEHAPAGSERAPSVLTSGASRVAAMLMGVPRSSRWALAIAFVLGGLVWLTPIALTETIAPRHAGRCVNVIVRNRSFLAKKVTRRRFGGELVLTMPTRQIVLFGADAIVNPSSCSCTTEGCINN